MFRDLALKGMMMPKSLLKTRPSLSSSSEDTRTFWHFVRSLLTKHEFERYTLLKHVRTDMGRGRAWLRSCLNENSLNRYLLTIFEDSNYRRLLNQYYDEEALFYDPEAASLLPNLARDLQTVLFAINIDNPEFDSGYDSVSEYPAKSDPMPVFPSSLPNADSRRKFLSPRVISLPDDENPSDDNLSIDSATSAPLIGGDSSPDPDTTIEMEVEDDPQAEGNRTVNGLRLRLTPFDETASGIHTLSSSIASDTGKWDFKTDKNGQELQKLRDENENLEEELRSFKVTFEEKQKTNDSIIESLRKENDILKVQLKKYISAIQMLKSGERSESPSDHNSIPPTPGESPMSSFNYYHEVSFFYQLVAVYD